MHITLQIKQPYYKIIRVHLIAFAYTVHYPEPLSFLGVMAGSFKEQQASLFSSIVQAGRRQEHNASSRSFMKRP